MVLEEGGGERLLDQKAKSRDVIKCEEGDRYNFKRSIYNHTYEETQALRDDIDRWATFFKLKIRCQEVNLSKIILSFFEFLPYIHVLTINFLGLAFG